MTFSFHGLVEVDRWNGLRVSAARGEDRAADARLF
jgi:hypothetical protein